MKKSSILLLLLLCLFAGMAVKATPKLNSYPAAEAVVFLDFDGHFVAPGVWNGGNGFACEPALLSDGQITEIFNRVSEDFRPFNLNITTDSAVFLNAPVYKRIRMVVTPTSSWYPGVAGVSWVNSFTWGDDTPGFIFSNMLSNNAKYIAECCSHESGHALGLSHQSKYDGANCSDPVETYNSGTGNGEVSWAPIMGNSYGRNMTNWNNGPTPWGCTSVQDNLSILSTQSDIGFRTDDYGDFYNTATVLSPNGFAINGVITTNIDKDAFALSLVHNAGVHIAAAPFSAGAASSGANLDIKVDLLDAAGVLIQSYNPQAVMGVTIDTVLSAGTYYLVIDGTGNTNIGEYGSLGSYTLYGTAGALPVKSILLSGSNANGKHQLNWAVTADEIINTQTVQAAEDGINFTTIAVISGAEKSFAMQPYKSTNMYYRIKAQAANGEYGFSNIISLKSTAQDNNIFSVSSFIQSNSISVTAPETYHYQLTGINGVSIQKGTGTKGYNAITTANLPAGIYVMQLISNNKIQTERIIRQ